MLMLYALWRMIVREHSCDMRVLRVLLNRLDLIVEHEVEKAVAKQKANLSLVKDPPDT